MKINKIKINEIEINEIEINKNIKETYILKLYSKIILMIKDGDVIKVLLSEKLSPNQLVKYFSLIIILKQRYNSLLNTEKFVDLLTGVDKTLWMIISVLTKTKKNQIREIKRLIFLVKKMEKYQTELAVEVESNSFDAVEKLLKGKLPKSNVLKKEPSTSELNISWNGWYYKKSFEKDVEKLLS